MVSFHHSLFKAILSWFLISSSFYFFSAATSELPSGAFSFSGAPAFSTFFFSLSAFFCSFFCSFLLFSFGTSSPATTSFSSFGFSMVLPLAVLATSTFINKKKLLHYISVCQGFIRLTLFVSPDIVFDRPSGI
jgi:hypothetical protein